MTSLKNTKLWQKSLLIYRKNKIQKAINNSGYFLTIDTPTEAVKTPYFVISGVLFIDKKVSIENINISVDQSSSPVNLIERKDLINSYSNFKIVGFSKLVLPHEGATSITLTFKLDNKSIEHPLAISFSTNELADFINKKNKKLDKINSLIQYPLNNSNSKEDKQINSSSPGASYNFLSKELIDQGGVKATGNISAHDYDQYAIQLLEKHKDGIILDNGCGLRNTYYPQVVNFEIVDYPSTDVLGIGEALPFKDNSFDAVFSLSVLEHVKDPFLCAKEIMRVLKPGGDLYVAVPFLQPFHGYPNHFYNMTSSGLKNLFDPELLQVKEVGVSKAGHPIWSLNWFLNSYKNGLPLKDQNDFLNLKVGDLLSTEISQKMNKGYISNLSTAAKDELACFNFLLGSKSL